MVSGWGFPITADTLTAAAHDVGETTLLSRAGGAPTFAVGMAKILADAVGGRAALAYWYHFAILFEALFILTTISAGTRVARFMLQDLFGTIAPGFRRTDSWPANLAATGIAVAAWGYFLYQGVVDPLGGINTLWPLFGIANQMLAAIALTTCNVVLCGMKRQRYLWVTLTPTLWLLVCTMTAGWEKLFDPDPAIGFLSHAGKFAQAAASGQVLAPARTMVEMNRVVLNDRVDAALCALFMAVVVSTVLFGLAASRRALAAPGPTTHEEPDFALQPRRVGPAACLIGGNSGGAFARPRILWWVCPIMSAMSRIADGATQTARSWIGPNSCCSGWSSAMAVRAAPAGAVEDSKPDGRRPSGRAHPTFHDRSVRACLPACGNRRR